VKNFDKKITRPQSVIKTPSNSYVFIEILSAMAAAATSPIGLQLILLPSTVRKMHNLNSPGHGHIHSQFCSTKIAE
jgi:hypothetical protein